MKYEDLRFSVYVESHNDLGEKQRSPIHERCTRHEVIKTADSLGISLNYTAPYAMKKEKQFAIEKEFIPLVRDKHFVTIGEFRHEPLLCIKRLKNA